MEANLRPHQLAGLDRVRSLNGAAGLFMEMSTGKTRTALSYVHEVNCRRVLCVIPIKAALVWIREVRKIGMDIRIIDLTEGTIQERRDRMRRAGDALVLVNYDVYWRKPLREALLNWRPDGVILDEAHRIRHRGARQSRFAFSLADRAHVRSRLALTGTPSTNGLQDIWAIYRFIDKRIFGSWSEFEGHYIERGGFKGYEIKRYLNVEEAHRLIEATSYQCAKDESTLPPRSDFIWPVRMSDASRRVYEEIKKEGIVQIEQAAGTATAIATIALTLIMRLAQITSGFVKTVDSELVELNTDKADAVVDIVETAMNEGNQVVVFCRFTHDIDLLYQKLSSAGYGVDTVIMDGRNGKQHRRIIDVFQSGGHKILLAQIKVASESIDLTAANVGIFFSTGYSLLDFLQSRDRLHREGQTKPVVYYHLQVENSVDEKILEALRRKHNIAQEVTNLRYALEFFR